MNPWLGGQVRGKMTPEPPYGQPSPRPTLAVLAHISTSIHCASTEWDEEKRSDSQSGSCDKARKDSSMYEVPYNARVKTIAMVFTLALYEQYARRAVSRKDGRMDGCTSLTGMLNKKKALTYIPGK